MVIALSICILILRLCVFSFIISADGHIDVFGNDGYIRVKLFGLITVFKTQAFVKHEDVIHNDLILKNKRKEYLFHINADKNDKKSISRLLEIKFIPNVNVEELALTLAIGKRDDAVFTTVLLAGVRAGICAFLAKMKSIQKVKIFDEFIPEYNKDVFSLRFFGIIDLSIADIIYGYISTKGGKK